MKKIVKSIERVNDKLLIEKIDTGYVVKWDKHDKTIESNLLETLPEAIEVFETWLTVGVKK